MKDIYQINLVGTKSACLNPSRLAGLLALIAALSINVAARAANYYKQNNTNVLCVAASWAASSGGTVAAGPPGSADIAIWDGADTASATPAGLATNSAWLGIEYGMPTTGSPTVMQVVPNSSGGTLTLGSSGINMTNATSSFDFGRNITFASGASQAWNIAAGQILQLDGTINTSGNSLTLNQSGSGASGTIVLTGGNTVFNTPVTIGAGILQIGKGSGGPGFTVAAGITDNGQLLIGLSSANICAVAGPISGTGNLNVSSGILTLIGTNSFTGGTVVTGGELVLGTNNAIANLSSLLGTGTVSNNSAIVFNAANQVTVTNAISGLGSLTVSNGTAVLYGTNTYTGPTTINAGVLTVNNTQSLKGTSQINIGRGALLNTASLATALTLNTGQALGAGTAAGTIDGSVNIGAGALNFNYTNGTTPLTITNGTLTLSNNSVLVTVIGSALGAGSYTLVATGTGGMIAGSALNSFVTVIGSGLAANDVAKLQSTVSTLSLVVSTAPSSPVSAYDTTMLPVVLDNLPAFGYITAYDVNEQTVSNAIPAGQQPLYYPYQSWDQTNNVVYEDSTNDAWWDNLVAEQLQARPSVVMLSTCGVYTTNLTDLSGPGAMNPRRLQFWVNAVNRAGATNVFQTGCFAEAAAQGIYQNYYHLTNSALYDFSSTDAWNQVWWLRIIKPWFDNVPSNTWYSVNGGIPVEFWGLNINSIYTNQQGNVSKMFGFLATNIYTTYGVWPRYIMGSINSTDTTLTNNPWMVGDNEWFSPPTNPYSMRPYKGYVWGGMVAGYINPNFYTNPTNSQYGATNTVLVRTGINGWGVFGTNGNTMMDGLNAAINTNAVFTAIEGYDDVSESCGPYRSLSTNWSWPNQYLDILRAATDLRTATLQLQAEGCDQYGNAAGNPFGIYRRTGTLGISDITGTGWAVSGTVAGEWIQFTNLLFSPGNYKFSVRYSASASHSVQLYVDGAAQPAVTLSSTGGLGIFNNAYLATNALSYGQHSLKVVFVDGGVALDWLFVKKYDSLLSFQSATTANYLTAELGGNVSANTIVNNRASAGAWEQFTIDDLTGSGSIHSGDTVNIQSYDGLYFTAENGGGGQLSCNRRVPQSWESWTILNVGGGTGVLTNGAQIAFRSSSGTNYLTAVNTGTVNVSGATIGAAQTFTIQISSLQAPPPTPPTGLAATAASPSQVNLSWHSYSGNATLLAIKRSTNGSSFSWLAYVNTNVTSYSDTGLATNVTYYYEILASNPSGNSPQSLIVNATPLASSPHAIVSPISGGSGDESLPLVLLGLNNNVLTLQWPGNVSNAALYYTLSLAPPISWLPVTNAPVLENGVWQLSLPCTNTTGFFQLRQNE